MTPEPNFILLVENDPDDQLLFCEAFTEKRPGAVVRCVEDGVAALEFLQSCDPAIKPSFFLIDYAMPRMNGPELLDLLHSLPHFLDVPKIIWSTSKIDAHRSECLRKGAAAYLYKPNSMADLNQTVEYLSELYARRD